MKKKFSRILGVVATIALLASLTLFAAPVSAISQATVTITDADDDISMPNADYAIFFTIYEELGYTDADTFDKIVITFPEDTVIAAPTATIGASPGWIGGSWDDATTTNVTFDFDATDLTISAELGAGDEIGENASVRIEITAGITNPTTEGDYTLDIETFAEDAAVDTSIEDLATSETYEIEAPTVDPLPGIVEVYNPSDTLMAAFTGDDAVIDAITAATDADWVIKLGPGTYYDTDDDFNTAVAGVTFEAAGDVTWEGAALVDVDDITIDGIIFDGDLTVTGDDFILQNAVIDDAGTLIINAGGTDATIDTVTFNVEDDVGIEVDEDDTVITDCTFIMEENGRGISVEDGGTDTDVEDSTFTGDAGEGVGIEVLNVASNLEVEGSTFDDLATAFDINGGTADITGNTIQNSEGPAIDIDGAALVTIHNNTITGNDNSVIIDIADDTNAATTLADDVFMMFNTITDNVGDEDGVLVDNNDAASTDDIPFVCVNNWWGNADGPPEGEDAFAGEVTFEPYLPGPIATSAIETAVAFNTPADFETATSVIVESTAGAGVMDIVGAAQYTANPVAAIDNATGFWDVSVIDPDAAITEITIRIYTTVTEDTEVWVWGEARGEWLEAVDAAGDPNYTPNLFAGFIAIAVTDLSVPTIDDLAALPFVVIEEPALATAVDITAPTIGAVDISVTPTLAWTAVADATYEVQIAQDATFAILDEAATSPTNAYIVTTALAEGQSYYWRVRAVTDAGAGAWATGVFTTATPEPEAEPPIVIEEAPPAPEITVTIPAPTVTQAIDPGLLWAIIGVGAVLVISLIVLIVRTRRAV